MSPLSQIAMIARMELRRAFFSRRALWVYLLALFPAVIFFGHAIDVKLKRQRWNTVSPAMLNSFTPGASEANIITRAGEPIMRRTWKRRMRREDPALQTRTDMTYFDGARRADLYFEEGKLIRSRMQPLLNLDEDRQVFAGMFQYFYLRLAVFFGCLGIFINLFRGEMLDKSLHFWFLAPVRRDVLLLGKYCAGLIASSVIFTVGALLAAAALLAPYSGAELDAFWQAGGLSHIALYAAATALGCLGYGSIFLAAGLLLRNPIIPAVVILIWESINGFLPDMLQKLSVLHYLQSICPEPAPMDSGAPPFLRLLLSPAAPAPAWSAVLGLLTLTALVLWAASRAVKRLEINYGTE